MCVVDSCELIIVLTVIVVLLVFGFVVMCSVFVNVDRVSLSVCVDVLAVGVNTKLSEFSFGFFCLGKKLKFALIRVFMGMNFILNVKSSLFHECENESGSERIYCSEGVKNVIVEISKSFGLLFSMFFAFSLLRDQVIAKVSLMSGLFSSAILVVLRSIVVFFINLQDR